MRWTRCPICNRARVRAVLVAKRCRRRTEGSNMRKLLICLAFLAQSTGANGQMSTSEEEGCVTVSDTVGVCLTKNGRKTWAVTGSDGQLTFLPDPRVWVDVKTIPYDPEWSLNQDGIGSLIANAIAVKEGETLRAYGVQGSFQDWGHVATQDFEIISENEECFQFVTYQYIGDGAMLLISSHYCHISARSYGETGHYELLRSIWIR